MLGFEVCGLKCIKYVNICEKKMTAPRVKLRVPIFYYIDPFFFQTKTIVVYVKIQETFVPKFPCKFGRFLDTPLSHFFFTVFYESTVPVLLRALSMSSRDAMYLSCSYAGWFSAV